MALKDLAPGRYLACATRARFDQSSKKGTLFIEVEFRIKETGDHIRWQGYLTEATLEKTLETMALLDWNNDENFGEGSINTEKEVQLVVAHEEGKDDQGQPTGKFYPRVQWVNDPSRSKFDNLDAQTLKSKLSGYNLKAEMAAARKRLGLNTSPTNKTPEPSFDENEIPF